MIYKVSRPKGSLHTTISLPASKSISNRLLIIHALSANTSGIENLSESDDTVLMKRALKSVDLVKDIGHGGTAMRFLTAFYSCREGVVNLTGSDRMKERPIGPLVDALRLLGAEINYLGNKGFPPLGIKGKKLSGGAIDIKGNISSQFISALLMVAPTFEKGLALTLKGDVVSSAYIKMTLSLMNQYGAETKWTENTIKVAPGNYKLDGYTVESDWSAASYWYAMILPELHAKITLCHLEKDSLQGDSDLVNIFQKLGVVTEFKNKTASLQKFTNIIPGRFEYDFTDSPDLVQSMAVILSMSAIPFKFTGTQTLRIKETDRIAALQAELKKLGFILTSDPAGSYLEWSGKRCDPEKNPLINTYHDHRMAMAFVPAALVLGEIRIDAPLVVSKSYPGFWKDLKKAGFGVEEE